jgi:hypothetical protein
MDETTDTLECEVCLMECEVRYSKGSGVVCRACYEDEAIVPVGPDMVLIDTVLA